MESIVKRVTLSEAGLGLEVCIGSEEGRRCGVPAVVVEWQQEEVGRAGIIMRSD